MENFKQELRKQFNGSTEEFYDVWEQAVNSEEVRQALWKVFSKQGNFNQNKVFNTPIQAQQAEKLTKFFHYPINEITPEKDFSEYHNSLYRKIVEEDTDNCQLVFLARNYVLLNMIRIASIVDPDAPTTGINSMMNLFLTVKQKFSEVFDNIEMFEQKCDYFEALYAFSLHPDTKRVVNNERKSDILSNLSYLKDEFDWFYSKYRSNIEFEELKAYLLKMPIIGYVEMKVKAETLEDAVNDLMEKATVENIKEFGIYGSLNVDVLNNYIAHEKSRGGIVELVVEEV